MKGKPYSFESTLAKTYSFRRFFQNLIMMIRLWFIPSSFVLYCILPIDCENTNKQSGIYLVCIPIVARVPQCLLKSFKANLEQTSWPKFSQFSKTERIFTIGQWFNKLYMINIVKMSLRRWTRRSLQQLIWNEQGLAKANAGRALQLTSV